MNLRMGADPWVAHAREGYARLLAARPATASARSTSWRTRSRATAAWGMDGPMPDALALQRALTGYSRGA
jgi:hypothetical protein